jgi:putative transposase
LREAQELLLRNEYLAAENRILRAQVQGRLLLSDAEKATLAGRKALEGLAAAAKPDTLLAWYRMLIAHKFDGSKCRKTRGRPPSLGGKRAVGGADGEGKSQLGL